MAGFSPEMSGDFGHEEPLSHRELMKLATKWLLEKFQKEGLKPQDIADLGPDVPIAKILPFSDFDVPLVTFVERNLLFDQQLVESAWEEFQKEYPVADELGAQVVPSDILPPVAERKLRHSGLFSRLKPNVDSLEMVNYWQSAQSALQKFVDAIINTMSDGEWDEGYDDELAEVGIQLPSEVIRRQAFIDVIQAFPRGVIVGDRHFLGFYVPDDMVAVEEHDDWDEDLEDEEDDWESGEEDDDDKDGWNGHTNLVEPERYLIITDPVVGELSMEWLFLESEFQALAEYLLATFVDRQQQAAFAVLEEFFNQVAQRKRAKIEAQIEKTNATLRHLFWRRLEMALEFKPYVKVHWSTHADVSYLEGYFDSFEEPHDPARKPSALDYPTLDPAHFPAVVPTTQATFTFRRNYKGSIYVDVSVGYLGTMLGSMEIRRHIPDLSTEGADASFSWVFTESSAEGETQSGDKGEVGAFRESDEGFTELSDAEASLNELLQRMGLVLPADLSGDELYVREARTLSSELSLTSSLGAFIALFNMIGVKGKDGTVSKMTLETNSGDVYLKGMVVPPDDTDPSQN